VDVQQAVIHEAFHCWELSVIQFTGSCLQCSRIILGQNLACLNSVYVSGKNRNPFLMMPQLVHQAFLSQMPRPVSWPEWD